MKSHSPIWIVHEVPTELIEKALPCLVESKKRVDEKYAEKNGKNQKLLDCLKSAQGCLLSMDHLIRRFVNMSASRVKVDEDGIISMCDLPACKHHNHPAFSHELFRSESCLKFAANVSVVEQEHVSCLECVTNKDNAAADVITSSNVLKSLISQVLQVVNNNSIQLKLILSNEKDRMIENSNENRNEPVITNSPEAVSSEKKQAQPGRIM